MWAVTLPAAVVLLHIEFDGRACSYLPLLQNLEIVKKVRAVAARHDCTPGQIALAWLHAQVSLLVVVPSFALARCVCMCTTRDSYIAIRLWNANLARKWSRCSHHLRLIVCPWLLQGPDVVPIPCVPSALHAPHIAAAALPPDDMLKLC
jgi:hypothetical protein